MPAVASSPSPEAERALAYLHEISPEMRGCAILASDGSVLAATGGERDAWAGPARELVAAADAAGAEPITHAHVATEEGEAFCVRDGGLVGVAVTARYALASLMIFDLRVALRQIPADAR